jgi:hypothetical protein
MMSNWGWIPNVCRDRGKTGLLNTQAQCAPCAENTSTDKEKALASNESKTSKSDATPRAQTPSRLPPRFLGSETENLVDDGSNNRRLEFSNERTQLFDSDGKKMAGNTYVMIRPLNAPDNPSELHVTAVNCFPESIHPASNRPTRIHLPYRGLSLGVSLQEDNSEAVARNARFQGVSNPLESGPENERILRDVGSIMRSSGNEVEYHRNYKTAQLVEKREEQKDPIARPWRISQAQGVAPPADLRLGASSSEQGDQKPQDHVVQPGEKLNAKPAGNKEDVEGIDEIKKEGKDEDEEIVKNDKDLDGWEVIELL